VGSPLYGTCLLDKQKDRKWQLIIVRKNNDPQLLIVLAMKSMLNIVHQYDLQGNMIKKWDHVPENRGS